MIFFYHIAYTFFKVTVFFGIVRWIPAQLVNPAVNSHTLMSLMVLKNVFPAQPVIQPVSVFTFTFIH